MKIRHKKTKIDLAMVLLLILLSTAERIHVAGIPVYIVLFFPLLFRGLFCAIRNNKGLIAIDLFEITILVWAVLGTLLSCFYGMGGDYRGLEGLLINSLIMIIIYTYREEGFDYSFLIGLICGLVINVIIGLMEIHINGFHVVSNFNEYYTRIFRNKAVGFQVNENDYCAMLITYIVGLLFLIEKKHFQNKTGRLLIYSIIGVSIYVLVRDFSRAAILSLLIVVTYILSYKIFGKQRWRIISIFIFALGCIVLYSTNIIETRFSAFIDVNSDSYRLRTYIETWEFIKNHYFLGVGASNTTRLMGISQHNLILETLSDYGIIVTILFMITLLRLLNYKSKMDKGNGYYLIMLFGICFLLSGFSVSSLFRIRIIWVFYAYFSRQLREAAHHEYYHSNSLLSL